MPSAFLGIGPRRCCDAERTACGDGVDPPEEGRDRRRSIHRAAIRPVGAATTKGVAERGGMSAKPTGPRSTRASGRTWNASGGRTKRRWCATANERGRCWRYRAHAGPSYSACTRRWRPRSRGRSRPNWARYGHPRWHWIGRCTGEPMPLLLRRGRGRSGMPQLGWHGGRRVGRGAARGRRQSLAPARAATGDGQAAVETGCSTSSVGAPRRGRKCYPPPSGRPLLPPDGWRGLLRPLP